MRAPQAPAYRSRLSGDVRLARWQQQWQRLRPRGQRCACIRGQSIQLSRRSTFERHVVHIRRTWQGHRAPSLQLDAEKEQLS
jgi:hypothetical protein